MSSPKNSTSRSSQIGDFWASWKFSTVWAELLCNVLSWSYLFRLSPHLHLISALLQSHFLFPLLPFPCLLPFPIGFPLYFFYSKNKKVKCHFHHEKMSKPPSVLKRENDPCKEKTKPAAVCQSSSYKPQRSQDTVCARLPPCMHTYSFLMVLTDLQVSSHCIKADSEMFSKTWS